MAKLLRKHFNEDVKKLSLFDLHEEVLLKIIDYVPLEEKIYVLSDMPEFKDLLEYKICWSRYIPEFLQFARIVRPGWYRKYNDGRNLSLIEFDETKSAIVLDHFLLHEHSCFVFRNHYDNEIAEVYPILTFFNEFKEKYTWLGKELPMTVYRFNIRPYRCGTFSDKFTRREKYVAIDHKFHLLHWIDDCTYRLNADGRPTVIKTKQCQWKISYPNENDVENEKNSFKIRMENVCRCRGKRCFKYFKTVCTPLVVSNREDSNLPKLCTITFDFLTDETIQITKRQKYRCCATEIWLDLLDALYFSRSDSESDSDYFWD